MCSCGEFSYKRGASASDLENTKKTCVAENINQSGIDKCMADNGWVVQNLSGSDQAESDLFAEVAINPDNRKTGNQLNIATKNIDIKESSSDKDLSLPTVKRTTDPMETFKISSWWKIGNSTDSLKTAIGECVASLGKTHQPNYQTHQVTRGLLLCMKTKGWRGLHEK